MKHFMKQGGSIHAFEADGSQDEFITADMTPISDAELAALRAPTLADLRTAKRVEIVKDRNAAITSGFTYLNKPIDSDRDSVMAITGAAVAALAAQASGQPYSVTWTCADDTTLTLDAAGVMGMSVALAMYADAQHTRGRPLKAQVEAAYQAGDRVALEAVAW